MIRTDLSQTYCTPHQLRIREIGKLRSRDRKGAVTKPTAPRFTALVTASILTPLTEPPRDRLVTAMADVERLILASRVRVEIIDPRD